MNHLDGEDTILCLSNSVIIGIFVNSDKEMGTDYVFL